MMMAAGFEKVYEIGPIFRAEEHNTTKHLNEATSIDIEMSYADHFEVMGVLEQLIVKTYEYVGETCSDQIANLEITDFIIPKAPFPRLPYGEAIEIAKKKIEDPIQYGDDISPAAERAIGAEIGGHYFIVDWPSAIRPIMPCLMKRIQASARHSTLCIRGWNYRVGRNVSTSMISSFSRSKRKD
jgi:aspartyl-tRNA synthetase